MRQARCAAFVAALAALVGTRALMDLAAMPAGSAMTVATAIGAAVWAGFLWVIAKRMEPTEEGEEPTGEEKRDGSD